MKALELSSFLKLTLLMGSSTISPCQCMAAAWLCSLMDNSTWTSTCNS